MRKQPFVDGEFYHIYNRGVDKRNIFTDEKDIDRFIQSMKEFNVTDPIGSIYENSFNKLGCPTPKSPESALVNFICYCLNPNHYHFILEQVIDGGISEFMKRLGGGYTSYFNNKYQRSGALFQGRFKSAHINSNEYLLHVGAYVNLNNHVHQLGCWTPKLVSSWEEYMGNVRGFCKKDILLEQFKNINEYKIFAEDSLKCILEKQHSLEDIKEFLLE